MYVFIYFKTKQTHSVIMNMFMKVVEVFFYILTNSEVHMT